MHGRVLGLLGAALLVASCGGEDFTSSSEGTGGAGPGAGAGSTGSQAVSATASSASGGGCTCVPPVPSGWEGPAMLHHGTGMPPTCSAQWEDTLDGHAGNVTAPFSCSSCDCAPPSGVICSPHELALYAEDTCMNSADAMTTPTGACENLPNSFLGVRLYGPDSQPSGGSCAPTGGEGSKGEPVWDEQIVVCTGVVGGQMCDGGGVCAPTPSESFLPGLCIHQDGNVDCPEPFLDKRLVYRGVTDDRECGKCSCGLPSGSDCSKQNYAFTDSACIQGKTAIGPFCESASPSDPWVAVSFVAEPSGGGCVSSHGPASGELQPGSPLTVCCLAVQ